MGTPAAVQGDQIVGVCAIHLMPSASGTMPAGPQPFGAPLQQGLATSVLVCGKPAAVQGSSGYNTPPHLGLADAFASPTTQEGRVLMGSATVLFENKSAAKTGATVAMCAGVPGQIVGSAATVLIGG